MAESFYVSGLFSRANCTFSGLLTLFGTSCFLSYAIAVNLMSGCRNGVGAFLAATCTGTCFNSCLGAGGFFGNFRILEIVTERLYVSGFGLRTYRAGALLRALLITLGSRGLCPRSELVTGSFCNGLGLGCVALSTFKGLNSCFLAGCLLSYCSFVPAMVGFFYLLTYRACAAVLSAACTGICAILMVGGFCNAGGLCCVAGSTGKGFLSRLLTVCSFGYSAAIPSMSLGFNIAASGAGADVVVVILFAV